MGGSGWGGSGWVAVGEKNERNRSSIERVVIDLLRVGGNVAVAGWQWQFDSGSGCSGSGSGCSGKVVVAVAGWQGGRVAGEKMERIGPVLRELCVFVAVAVMVVTVAKW
jgi:hypothetical protein